MQRRGDPDSQALQVIETQPYIEPQTKPFKLFTKKAGGDASPKEDNQSARHAARPSYKDEKAVEEAELQRRAICEEILVSGCVQSFVDFFYLMHRPDPKAGKGTRSMSSPIDAALELRSLSILHSPAPVHDVMP